MFIIEYGIFKNLEFLKNLNGQNRLLIFSHNFESLYNIERIWVWVWKIEMEKPFSY